MASQKSAMVQSAAPATKSETTGELVKTLASTLKIQPKKLRRYLRAQKFQRTEKKWFLSTKQVEQVRGHFTPKPAEAKAS